MFLEHNVQFGLYASSILNQLMFATSIRLRHKGIGISLTPQWCAGGAHLLLQTVWTKHRAVSHSSGLKAWWKRKWQTEVVDLSQQPGNKIDGPACFYKARLNVQHWYFPPLIIKHTLPTLDSWKCPSCINKDPGETPRQRLVIQKTKPPDMISTTWSSNGACPDFHIDETKHPLPSVYHPSTEGKAPRDRMSTNAFAGERTLLWGLWWAFLGQG